MSAPINISSTPHPSSLNPTTPSSAQSISPQTPFSPLSGLNLAPQNQPFTAPTQSSSAFLKWATTLSKSPPARSPVGNPFDMPVGDDEHHEHHDSFEFGDIGHMKSGSWGGNARRAVSVSHPGGRPSGISAMLTGFGSGQAQAQGQQAVPAAERDAIGAQQHARVGSWQGGVMADRAAKGQGILRRLSIGAGGFNRPSFLSPTLASAPLPTSPTSQPQNPMNQAQTPMNTAVPVQVPQQLPPKADQPVQRAVTLGTGARRHSETGKKRGVSPMGERILRDHGHF